MHYGPGRTGYQPNETQIGTGNVGRLAQARTYRAAANPSAPLIANGVLYVDTGTLYAFDATGAANCSAAPAACTPLWTAPTAYFHGMTIANGDVYVSDGEGIQAFDAAGSKNCSGTPKVCVPLWATSTHSSTGPAFTPGSGSPVVAGGVLYVPGYGDGLPLSTGGAYVAAFDAAGSAGCSGSPTVCVPMWTTTGLPASTANTGSPAIGANGVLYIANQTLYAFDAAGSASCSGTPKVCAPLWTAATSNSPTYSAPAVANGTVYVGSWNAKLYAFGAAGSTNCSASATGKTCTPLWTAATPASIGGTPAVANGVVYTVSGNGTLSAFDAAGSKDCSGTVTAKTCTPLWRSAARRERIRDVFVSRCGERCRLLLLDQRRDLRVRRGRIAELLRLRHRHHLLPALGRRHRLHRRRIACHRQRSPLHQRLRQRNGLRLLTHRLSRDSHLRPAARLARAAGQGAGARALRTGPSARLARGPARRAGRRPAVRGCGPGPS